MTDIFEQSKRILDEGRARNQRIARLIPPELRLTPEQARAMQETADQLMADDEKVRRLELPGKIRKAVAEALSSLIPPWAREGGK